MNSEFKVHSLSCPKIIVINVRLGFVIQIADYLKSGGARPEEFALGLNNGFETLGGHDIGQFSGLESSTEANPIQAYQSST